jgi:uroporphyrinogen-III synthase
MRDRVSGRIATVIATGRAVTRAAERARTRLAVELTARRASRVAVHGHALELRGHAVVLDRQLKPIAPAPMAILRALARRPGHVVSRTELTGVRRAATSRRPYGAVVVGHRPMGSASLGQAGLSRARAR